MRLKDLMLSLLVDLIVFVLVTEYLPSTTPYVVVLALLTPTVFWICVNSVTGKRKRDD